eukprot:327941-Hanusia_phi.AAC.3
MNASLSVVKEPEEEGCRREEPQVMEETMEEEMEEEMEELDCTDAASIHSAREPSSYAAH